MKKSTLYLLFWLCAMPVLAVAQAKRPQVLVYGSGPDAFAAAMQAAMSNLNTVWLSPDDKLVSELTTQMGAVTSNQKMDGGIWASLLARTLNHEEQSDSISATAKLRINPQIAENAINEFIGRYPHLTLVRGAQLGSIRKVRKNWQVELANRVQYRVRALVDGSAQGDLIRAALPNGGPDVKTQLSVTYFETDAYDPLTRTGVAVADLGHPAYTLPLGALVPADDSNVFGTRTPAIHALLTGSANDIPLLMHVGQAVGAAAAYTAFYEATSDKLDVRSVQGEIVQYGGRLVPFQDVPLESPHFKAIQRIGATGLLVGTYNEQGLYLFEAGKTVSTGEIASVMDRLYSRSQIWFTDNQADTMRMADLLSLIKYVGLRGDELEGHVEKNWERRYQFTDAFTLDMPVTRRHFAVLMDAYCRPFDVKVGLDGTIYR